MERRRVSRGDGELNFSSSHPGEAGRRLRPMMKNLAVAGGQMYVWACGAGRIGMNNGGRREWRRLALRGNHPNIFIYNSITHRSALE